MKLLIICYVPELNVGNSMKNLAAKIQNAFVQAGQKRKKILDVIVITERNRARVIKELSEMKEYLQIANRKGIVYYYGHGDQVRDRSGDEIDGKDEMWKTQGILDDDLSKMFTSMHNTSKLYVFSDSCSSGSMIDKKYNTKDWVTFSSCNDAQDSLATSDGGVFTLWGLIPALQNLAVCSPYNIHRFICRNVEIHSQSSLLHFNQKKTLYEDIFQ